MLFLAFASAFALIVVPIWALGVYFWEQDHPEE